MGLDINIFDKPVEGTEDEFQALWVHLQLLKGNQPTEAVYISVPDEIAGLDFEIALERLRDISQVPGETIGAPVVGKDAAADQYVKERFGDKANGAEEVSQAMARFRGYPIMDIMPVSDGFPVYSNYGAGYDGLTRASFRGEFLRGCPLVLSDIEIGNAWHPMLAGEFAAWGRDLRRAADQFAADNNLTHVLDNRDYQSEISDGPEAQLHIVDQAARWAKFWSELGHGTDPDF